MSNSCIKTKSCVKEEYNNIPVYYCKDCLSLKIRSVDSDTSMDYCDECGCTHVEKTDIHTWENLYINKYGFNYLNS